MMERVYRDGVAADPSPVSGVHPGADSEGSTAATVLEVDGELFELRPDQYGGTGYAWLSGPNDGYGFGTSPTPDWSTEEHRANIRWFLAQVDPATGYLADD